MEYEIVELKEKNVAGIKARLNNNSEDFSLKMGSLWEEYFKTIYGRVNDKTTGIPIGLYTNYSSDNNGDYDCYICSEVNSIAQEKDIATTKISAGKYAKFIVKGSAETAVKGFWSSLWNMDLDRKYDCDFEEYVSGEDTENMEIHMYISLN